MRMSDEALARGIYPWVEIGLDPLSNHGVEPIDELSCIDKCGHALPRAMVTVSALLRRSRAMVMSRAANTPP